MTPRLSPQVTVTAILGAVLLVAATPACCGRLENVLARGPYSHLQGIVLRQEIGNATAGAWSDPAAADWDGDGDVDLLVGNAYGDLLYFERLAGGYLGEPQQMLPEAVSLLAAAPVQEPVSPTVADLDGDGREDLILGMRGRVYCCRRGASGLRPAVELQTEGVNLAQALRAAAPGCGQLAPCAADLDRDGDYDLLIGDDAGRVWWVENRGSRQEPAFASPRRLAAGGSALSVGARARVTVGDWNDDGYPDVFVGSAGGTIVLCAGGRDGPGAPRPLYGLDAPAAPADTVSPQALSPVFCYWFGRGQGPRLVVGDRRGLLAVVGPISAFGAALEGYVQSRNTPLDAGRCASPYPVDWDGDGRLDLVVGGEDGYVQVFRRVGNAPPTFAMGQRVVDSSGWIRAAARPGWSQHLRYAWPCVADLDADGDLDLALGQADGHVRLWLNSGGLVPSGDLAVAGQVLALPGTTTVTAFDYDQDGDLDLFVGTRLMPGTTAQAHLSPEQVVYLENAAGKRGQPPLFIKAVRMDAFIESTTDSLSVRDADMLGISDLQPVHWNGDAIIDYLLGTRCGTFVFHSDQSRKAYPRLVLRAPGRGVPTPLLPPCWRAIAVRLTAGDPGLLCGSEELGWVTWYPRANLPEAATGS